MLYLIELILTLTNLEAKGVWQGVAMNSHIITTAINALRFYHTVLDQH
jgi:hypothetical protein